MFKKNEVKHVPPFCLPNSADCVAAAGRVILECGGCAPVIGRLLQQPGQLPGTTHLHLSGSNNVHLRTMWPHGGKQKMFHAVLK